MLGLQLLINVEGLTYQELANRLGITRQMIALWTSKQRQISENRLNQLSDIFNVSPSLLVKEIQEEKNRLNKKIYN